MKATKKPRKIVLILCIILLLTGACVLAYPVVLRVLSNRHAQSFSEEEKQAYALTTAMIAVTSGATSETHVYHVNGYGEYLRFFPEEHAYRRESLFHGSRPAMTQEEFDFFKEYIESIPKAPITPDSEFAYSVSFDCSYYPSSAYPLQDKERRYSITVEGYDAFPDGWEEFIKRANSYWGEELLSTSTTLQTFDAAFLEKELGIADASLSAGTVDDLLAFRYPSSWTGRFKTFLSTRTDEQLLLNGYEYSLFRENHSDLLDTYSSNGRSEIWVNESTGRELRAFVNAYLEILNDAWTMEQPNEDVFVLNKGSSSLYIGRTSQLSEEDYFFGLAELSPGGALIDAGMEGMTYSTEYYYHKSGKFFLVPAGSEGIEILEDICRFIDLDEPD